MASRIFIATGLYLLGFAMLCRAQLPQLNTDAAELVCDQVNINLLNTTTGATTHLWDRCLNNLKGSATTLQVHNSSSTESSGTSVIRDPLNNTVYLFTSNTGGTITRYNLGNQGNAFVSSTNFTTTGSTTVIACQAVVDSGTGSCHVFFVARSGTFFGRLDFGASFANTPTVVQMGNLSGALTESPHDFDIVPHNGEYHMIYCPSGSAGRIFTFSNGLAQPPVQVNTIAFNNGENSFKLIHYNSKWYAIGTNSGQQRYSVLVIGSTLTSSPITQVHYATTTINGARKTTLVSEHTNLYLFVANSSTTNIVKVDLGTNPESGANHIVTNLGDLGRNNTKMGIGHLKTFQNNSIFIASRSAPLELLRLNFTANCNVAADTVSTPVPAAYTYASAGLYTLAYRACNASGCRDTSMAIRVVEAPTTGFTSSPTCQGSATAFSNTSTIGALDSNPLYTWDFGDSSPTSSEVNPSHIFPPGGPYTVELHLTTAAGCEEVSTQLVSVNPAPVSHFSATTTCGQDSLLFTNNTTLASGNIVLARWFMGNGQVLERSTQAMTPFRYKYVIPGEYTVRMIVFTDQGCIDSLTQNVVQPSIDFAANNACLGQEASFVASVTPPAGTSIVSYTWDFGDGSNPVVNGDNVNHSFPFEGLYPVQVTASLDNGCDLTLQKSVQIAPPPVAAFSSTQRCTGLSTAFSQQSTTSQGTLTQWAWDFGDPASGTSNTSALANPTHIFATPGTYTVSLTVTNSLGCSHMTEQAVVINDAIDPEITTPAVICLGQPALLGTGSYSTYAWQIPIPGGNLLSTLQSPSFTFSQEGNRTITLTVTDANGCSLTTTEDITVNTTPTVDFTYTTGEEGALFTDSTYTFTSSAGAGDWIFGTDASILDISTTPYSFATPGTYVVSLTIRNDEGCQSTQQKTLTVINAPTPVLDMAVELLVPTRPITGVLQPRVRVLNTGNRNINQFVLQLWPEGNQPLEVPINHFLAEGNTLDTLLQLTWPARSSTPYSFFCVRVASINGEPDTIAQNNQICKVLDGEFMLDAVYPNPTQDLLWARFSTGEARPVFIQVLSAQGTTVWQQTQTIATAGVHTWELNTQTLGTGLYILLLQQGNTRIERTFQILR